MGRAMISKDLVLVVEDEPIIRMVGVDILEEAGYEVVEAANADEAIAVLEEASDVTLLFSDVDMPGSMDGVALATLVHERWPNIRLLLTSGHRSLSNADVPDDGCFLAKPYSYAQVVDEVRKQLGDVR